MLALPLAHTATSKKTLAANATTERLDLRVLKATSSVMYAKDKPRWLALNWVKNYIVEGFCPLSHGEKEWVRANWRLSCVPEFPVTGLHNKAVKHYLIELYAATTDQFKAEMAAEIAGGRLLHLNLDLWVDKFSSLKYIGKQQRGLVYLFCLSLSSFLRDDREYPRC